MWYNGYMGEAGILKRLKLDFPDAVRVRRLRFDYPRAYIAKKFNISRALVTKTCKYTDAEILRMYSEYDNPIFDHIRIANIKEYDDNVDGRVSIQYIDGPLAFSYTVPSLYYLLKSHFVPSFETLVDSSKITLITMLLLRLGYNNVTVAQVGTQSGIGSQYMAVTDKGRLSWQDLKNIEEFRTILDSKGDYYG